MTLKINSPEIDVRETLNSLKTPSGVGGRKVLEADSVYSAFDAIHAGRRNLIINGDFQVQQRRDHSGGYTIPASTNEVTMDRWKTRPYGTNTETVTRNEVVLPNGDYTYSMKVLENGSGTSGGGGFFHMIYPFEIYREMLGKTYTVSYWYRTNNVFNPRYCDNVSCYVVGRETVADEEWHQMQFQIAIPANATVGMNGQLHPAFTKIHGNIIPGDYFEYAQVQMEEGSVATPFEKISYQEQLMRCMRYYQNIEMGAYQRYGLGYSDINNRVYTSIPLATPMRGDGSVTVISHNNITVQGNPIVSVSTAAAGMQGHNAMSIVMTVSGTPFTVGQMYQIYSAQGLNNSHISFDAEF